MKRIFEWAGVDYRQWLAVSRTLVRADFRAPMPQTVEAYPVGSPKGIAMLALVFGLFGAAPAMLVVLHADVLFTGTVTLTYFAFALATALLAQHGATLLSPADHVILGSRPVSSRTIFAIRLTNVAFHALVLTTFMAYPPVLAFTFAHGTDVMRGLGAAAAIYGWALAVACATVAGYATLLRALGAATLQRVIGTVQLLTGFAAYGALFLAAEALGGAAQSGVDSGLGLRLDTWAAWLPPACFASIIMLFTGSTDPLVSLRAGLALASIGALGALLAGRAASDYGTRLSEWSSLPAPIVAHSRSQPLFTTGEGRAVAILAAAHFRHDLRVRMALFAMAPLIGLYVLIGVREGSAADPFLVTQSSGVPDLLSLAALMFPALVTRQLESSEAHRASWIYYATPADRGRLVVALKNVTTLYFLAPFGGVLTIVFTWRFAHAGHGFVHAAMLVAVSHLALQVAMALQPRLPFAQPADKLGHGGLFLWLAGVLIGGQLFLIWLQRAVYPSWPRVAACLAALVLLSCLMELVLRRRAARARD